jgi:hypothetical protein
MEIPKTLWLKRNMPKEKFDECMLFEYVFSQIGKSLTPAACPITLPTAPRRLRLAPCALLPASALTSLLEPRCAMRAMAARRKSARMDGALGSSTRLVRREQSSSHSHSGLESLVERGFDQLGGIPGKGGLILTAGQPVGRGLSKQAAEEFGLEEGVSVGSAVIDAWVILEGVLMLTLVGMPVGSVPSHPCQRRSLLPI